MALGQSLKSIDRLANIMAAFMKSQAQQTAF